MDLCAKNCAANEAGPLVFQFWLHHCVQHGGWIRIPDHPASWSTSSQELRLSNYGHTQVKPPHPVRSAQLNTWWQSQYYGGGPHGNTLCCNFFFLFSCLGFAARGIVQIVQVRVRSGPKKISEIALIITFDHCCFTFWSSLLITTVSLLIITSETFGSRDSAPLIVITMNTRRSFLHTHTLSLWQKKKNTGRREGMHFL